LGECLPHIKFTYNTTVNNTFEIVYGFNPLIPLDLLSMPDISLFKHKDSHVKVDYVKNAHERVKAQIKKKM